MSDMLNGSIQILQATRDEAVKAWRENAKVTIQRIWGQYWLSKKVEKKYADNYEFEKILSYAEDRMLTEGLIPDFIVWKNGRPDIDEGLVHEAMEVWEMVE